MKRGELVRQLTDTGCILYRHGSRHDIFFNPANGKKQPLPRHSEIDESLAKHINKNLGIR